MSTNFPGSLDSFQNPTPFQAVSAATVHSSQYSNLNDAVAAIQTKVGATSSAVTTTHDYKLSGVTGADKASSLAGTEVLTNKKLSDSTTSIVDVADNTKVVKFDVAGTTAITGTIATAFTTAKTVTLPDATDTLVGKATTDTLTNKTLTTPTIADLTNATHTHQNNAGGGQLSATSIFSGGTVPTARLGSGSATASTYLAGDQTYKALSFTYSFGDGSDGSINLDEIGRAHV